jgi:hypothetical protein
MNRAGEVPPSRRWLDWNPSDGILADSPQTDPTKPSKPSFVGFVGPLSVTPAIACGKAGVADASSDSGSAQNRVVNPIASKVDSATGRERVMSWSEWKAGAINRLFLEHGATGQSGRITAETVRHGQQARKPDPEG